jgi:RNA polymerase sigma-70 factor (ECF subfamily)
VSTDTDIQAGFLALLNAHRRLLYKVTRAYGRSAADRDDLAQESIVQLWRAYPRYDRRFKFSTWMYRITLNVAISWQRRERTQMRHRASEGEEILENVAVLDATLDREDVALLYASIERFDEIDRALLLLYLDGHSHAEIADVLGMTPTNVGTRIGRLREHLRKAFRQAGHLSSSLSQGEAS